MWIFTPGLIVYQPLIPPPSHPSPLSLHKGKKIISIIFVVLTIPCKISFPNTPIVSIRLALHYQMKLPIHSQSRTKFLAMISTLKEVLAVTQAVLIKVARHDDMGHIRACCSGMEVVQSYVDARR